MALASTLAGVFFITTFFSVLAIFIILRLGGKTFRQYIKSKFGMFKKKGSWILIFDKKRKVSLEFRTLPKDNRLLIKSGETPEDDQYANINEVYHQLDGSGNPVILAMEDLPFSFFLKKHHLNKFYPTIDKMVQVIDLAIAQNNTELINDLELKIKNKFIKAKDDLKYIPDAWKNYKSLMNLDKILLSESQVKGTEVLPINKLKTYKQILLDLKNSIATANHQIVNVYDLFETVGFVKNITKMAFSEYQNGWLAFRQAHAEKKLNTLLVIITIVVGVFVLAGIYLTYSQGAKLQTMQEAVITNSHKVDNLFRYINPDVNISDVNYNVVEPNKPVLINSGE